MADYIFGIGEELQFNSDDNALSHAWDFGDGVSSTLPNPVHAYENYGTYTITHTAQSFCGKCEQVSHTVEIVPASITVKSLLLDRYEAKVGDTVKITIIAQNTSNVYGTSTISIKFDNEVVAAHNVTLDAGAEGSYTVELQINRSGLIHVCADNVCTVLYVESSIIIESLSLSSNLSSGDPIIVTITARNTGLLADQRIIKTTVSNGTAVTLDERTISLPSGGSQTYELPIDVRALRPGLYSVCSDNTCKPFYAATPPPTVGDLSISSIPEGAEIFIDGKDQETVTPAVIRDISIGEHTFTLKLAGYNDTVGTFKITSGAVTYVYSILIPLSPTAGALDISSTPVGADIFVDGADQYLKTPAVITNLAEGSHTIKLTLQGFKDFSDTIVIKAGVTTYLRVSLVSAAPVPAKTPGVAYLAAGLLLIPLGLILTRKKEKKPEEHKLKR